ncbi:helix-turn-helix transcriptional regulator [Nitratireductor basaltis]|uniref:DNA-binding protein with HTH domain protein n=1 Tax=Nitratireductor basaltis TaxID=472175 RepID=A0A084UDE1_9HYPH|nr:LuxR family transcriptional regulator [Nitratireductor basaltis]KFB10977.1 DNA-binding protein with HTH domain protein [Nitratireductor basaltis]
MLQQNCEEFAWEISQLRTPDDVWDASCAYFAEQGFDGVFYADINGCSQKIRTNIDASWMSADDDPNYAARDPFFRHACNDASVKPTGALFLSEHPYLDDEERRFISNAGDTGLRAGLALPVRVRDQAGLCGWNILSSHGRALVDQHRRHSLAQLRFAALFSHTQMQQTAAAPVSASPLTGREMECLQWLACGMRTKEIARKTELSPATVEFHLRNARFKLGASTREHALALALRDGHITI